MTSRALVERVAPVSGARRRPAVRAALRRSGVVPGLLVTGCTVLVVVTLATGQRPGAVPEGLPDAGPWVAWTVLLSRVLLRLAALGTVGSLLVAGCLLPPDTTVPGRLSETGRVVARMSARWAVGWVVSALVLMVTSSAQLLGLGFADALTTPRALSYVPQLAEGRALMLMTPAVLALALHAGRLRSPAAARSWVAVSLLALVPLALAGHAAAAGSHYLATQSLLLHVLAVTVWTGGLVGIFHARRAPRVALALAVGRFSTLAMACFAVVGITGAVSAVLRLGSALPAWGSTYGALVVLKVGAFVGLGLAGWQHRRRTLPAMRDRGAMSFWRLAGAEVLLMSAAMGMAVLLSRTAPPARTAAVVAPHPEGVVDRSLPPVDALRLLSQWQPDAVVITVVAAGLLAAVAAVLGSTPAAARGRDAAVAGLVGGATVLVWALCGGLGVYARAAFSVHIAQVIVCAVLVPRLLAPAARLLVAFAEGGPAVRLRRSLRHVSDPLDAALVLSLYLAAVLAPPLLELVLRSPRAQAAVSAVGVLLGLLCLLGTRADARDEAHTAAARDALAGVVLALFGAMILVRPGLAQDWSLTLDRDGSSPGVDQRVGALLMAGSAGLLLLSGLLRRALARPWPGGRAGRRGRRSAPAARTAPPRSRSPRPRPPSPRTPRA